MGRGLLIALAIVGMLTSLSCDSSLFVGIATVGVSAVFAGSSPGFVLLDPAQPPPGVRVTPEDDVILSPGQSIERCLWTSGRLESDLAIEGEASGQGTLTFTATLVRADLRRVFAFETKQVQVTAAGPGQMFRIELLPLATQTTPAGEGPVLRMNPGDVISVQIAADATNTTDIVLHTATGQTPWKVEADMRVVQDMLLHLTLDQSRRPVQPVLAEDPTTRSVELQPGVATVFAFQPDLADATGPLYGNLLGQAAGDTTVPQEFGYAFGGVVHYNLHVESLGAAQTFALELRHRAPGATASDLLARVDGLEVGADMRQVLEGSFPPIPTIAFDGDANVTDTGALEVVVDLTAGGGTQGFRIFTDDGPLSTTGIRIPVRSVSTNTSGTTYSTLVPVR